MWLRGGTYYGRFVSNLAGSTATPIKVISYTGEQATINGNKIVLLSQDMPIGQPYASGQMKVSDSNGMYVGSYLKVENEYVQVYSISGNTLGVWRGWSGSNPVAHLSGAAVFFTGNIFVINGQDAIYQNLIVTDSNPVRAEPRGAKVHGTGVSILGPRVKVVNSVIHDTGQGIGFWVPAIDSEIYGNLIFNNGYHNSDLAVGQDNWINGHGIYMQNDQGVKTVSDNIIFNQFGLGMHAYSTNSTLNNFLIKGNIHFNDRFLVGGLTPLTNTTLEENYFYNGPLAVGYSNADNSGIMIKNNYLPDGLSLQLSKNVTVTGNTIWNNNGADVSIRFSGTDNKIGDYTFSNNTYYQPTASYPYNQFSISLAPPGYTKDYYWFNSSNNGYGYNGPNTSWQETLGYDRDSTLISTAMPSETFIRSNKYDKNRAHVIVYNWNSSNNVTVNLTGSGFNPGDTFDLRNAQNYLNELITLTSNSNNAITIPMTNWTIAEPIGSNSVVNSNILGKSTFPEFGAFVLIKTASGSGPPPPAACTSFTYSSWGTCSNGQQTRTVLTSSPADCVGGSPVTSQSCTVTPPDSDNDGVVNSLDHCPFTPATLTAAVNQNGCPKPLASSFDIKPNFHALNLLSIANLELGKALFGKVIFGQPVALLRDRSVSGVTYQDRLDLDSHLTFESKKITLNIVNLPELNKPATIVLYNVTGISVPKLLKDGEPCTTCTLVSFVDGTLTFNVLGFSTYEVIEGETPAPPPAPPVTSPPPPAPSGGGGGGGGGGVLPPAQIVPNVSSLTASPLSSSITLTWKNPAASASYQSTKVLRATALANQTYSAFSLIYEGQAERYADTAIVSGVTYLYKIQTKNQQGVLSTGVTVIASIGIPIAMAPAAVPQLPATLVEAQFRQILLDAAAIWSGQIEMILANAGSKRDTKKEQANSGQYLPALAKTSQPLTALDHNRLNYFITYGTKSAKILGTGERSGVLSSYQSAFGKLPRTETDWQDLIKIANGRWPLATSASALAKAKVSFKRLYGREAKLNHKNDNAAVTIMAYGLRPAKRNLNSEKAALRSFRYFIRRAPASALDWDMVRAIAYSGAKR